MTVGELKKALLSCKRYKGTNACWGPGQTVDLTRTDIEDADDLEIGWLDTFENWHALEGFRFVNGDRLEPFYKDGVKISKS